MIKNSIDFEKIFVERLGDINRTSLSSLSENKLRFELGGEEDGLLRIKQALHRSNQIIQYCFEGLAIWLRIILWDEDAGINLTNAGLDKKNADSSFKNSDNPDEEVLYLHFNKCSPIITSPILTSIINYEMAEEPSANVTCYFINLEKSIIVNVYDDRGIDIYSQNKNITSDLADKFHDWLI
ncbi:hypothetical protein D9M68_591130 [compost metagenome]